MDTAGRPGAMLVAMLILLAATLVTSASAATSTFTVTETDLDADDPATSPCADQTEDCTLRSALREAGTAGGPVVVVLPGAAQVDLTLGQLEVDTEVTIRTGGATPATVRQTTEDARVLRVTGDGRLTLRGVVIEGGHLLAGDGGGIFSEGILHLEDATVVRDNEARAGGGIFIGGGGLLEVTDSTISANRATEGAGLALTGGSPNAVLEHSVLGDNVASGDGGGAWISTGILTVTASEVRANTAASGAGVFVAASAPAALTVQLTLGTTVEDNTATVSGGGVHQDAGTLTLFDAIVGANTADQGGGIAATGGSLSVQRSTVHANEAASGAGLLVGNDANLHATNSTVSGNTGEGLAITGKATLDHLTVTANSVGIDVGAPGSLTVGNTIVAGNDDDCVLAETTTTSKPNLYGDASCEPGPDDVVSDDPGLAGLADNGGRTPTHALVEGSPAIDAAEAPSPPDPSPPDQRGVARPEREASDLGAFELEAAPPSAPRDVAASPGDSRLTVTWSAPQHDGGAAITGYTVTVTPGPVTTEAADARELVVTGLDNDEPHTVEVSATNAVGDGPPATATATPVAPPPPPEPTVSSGSGPSGGGSSGGSSGGGLSGADSADSPSDGSTAASTASSDEPRIEVSPGAGHWFTLELPSGAAVLGLESVRSGGIIELVALSPRRVHGLTVAAHGYRVEVGSVEAERIELCLPYDRTRLVGLAEHELGLWRTDGDLTDVTTQVGGDTVCGDVTGGGSVHLGAPDVLRLAGRDRVETAASISRWRFQRGVAVAVVATAASYPDALAGGAAGGALGGPLLLTHRDELPEATASELRRLAPGRILVAGGPAVIGAGVARALETFGPVTRLAGQDRYETAAEIAAHAFPGGRRLAYLATGERFPDALAAGPAAATRDAPILLTRPDALPRVTEAQLARLGVDEVVLLGGRAAIGRAVPAALRAAGYTVTRVGGADRYETAAAIAAHAFDEADIVFVAAGDAFADALAGVPASAAEQAPLLLVGRNRLPGPSWRHLRDLAPRRIVVLGGPAAVAGDLEPALRAGRG